MRACVCASPADFFAARVCRPLQSYVLREKSRMLCVRACLPVFPGFGLVPAWRLVPELTARCCEWQMPSIFVRTLNGSVSVPQEGSVADLKEQIEARSGFAAESVRLAYNGHILADDELLEEFETQITLDL